MKTRTDYESVNLSTGKKARYVVGGGRRLTECEEECVRVFETAMKEVAIPEMMRARRLREEAWQRVKDLILD